MVSRTAGTFKGVIVGFESFAGLGSVMSFGSAMLLGDFCSSQHEDFLGCPDPPSSFPASARLSVQIVCLPSRAWIGLSQDPQMRRFLVFNNVSLTRI